MRTGRLGKSPPQVSTIGLGYMTMTGLYGASDDAEATAGTRYPPRHEAHQSVGDRGEDT